VAVVRGALRIAAAYVIVAIAASAPAARTVYVTKTGRKYRGDTYRSLAKAKDRSARMWTLLGIAVLLNRYVFSVSSPCFMPTRQGMQETGGGVV
jgi:hypothetical protein